MAKFKLEFDCDNDAFGDNLASVSDEVANILELAATQILDQGLDHNKKVTVMDSDSNKVGVYIYMSEA